MANQKFLNRIQKTKDPIEYKKVFNWVYQQNFSQSKINSNLRYLQRFY